MAAEKFVWKEIYVCVNTMRTVNLNFDPYGVVYYVSRTAPLPSATSISETSAPGGFGGPGIVSVSFYAADPGTYDLEYILDVDYQDGNGLTLIAKPVIRFIVRSASECDTSYANCCNSEKSISITWLNREGGIQNYIFNGVREYQVRMSDEKRFVGILKTARYSTRGNVYNGEIVSTKNIPKSHVDLLDSLRYAVQAWATVEFRDDVTERLTEILDVPILLDADSFTKYKSNANFYEVSLAFIYADPVVVQTQ